MGETLSQNINFLKANKTKCMALFLCILFIKLISSFYSIQIFSRLLSNTIAGDTDAVIVSVKYFILINIILAVLVMFKENSSFKLLNKSSFFMEDMILDKYLNMRYWRDHLDKGKTLSMFRQNANASSQGFVRFLIECTELFFALLFGSILIININVYIYLMCMAFIIIFVLVSNTDLLKMEQYSEDMSKEQNKMHGLLWDNVKNREVTPFLDTNVIANKYNEYNEHFLDSWFKLKVIYNKSLLLSTFGSRILIVATVILLYVVNNFYDINFEYIFELIIAVPIITDSVFNIPSKFAEYKDLKGKMRVVDDFLNIEEDYQGDVKLNKGDKIEISIKNLTYQFNDTLLFDNVNMNYKDGILSIIGESGSGKSTLLNLMMNIIQSPENTVFINGTDINNIDRQSYWDNIMMINSDSKIYSDSFVYNITTNNTTVDNDRIQEAIIGAGLSSFVTELQNGMYTNISDETISRGERQKILFARAFYSDKTVYFLDESTSALDTVAEKHIGFTLQDYARNKNVQIINITHRDELLNISDNVVKIENKKIIKVDKGV